MDSGRDVKVLAVISQKGGVGKTTLATALAVEAVRDGKNTVVFDIDPQASATFWNDTRADRSVAVSSVQASRLEHMLKAVREAGCDFVVIDTPPFAKDIANEAAQRADFVLMPTRPAVLDITAMAKTIELVRHYQRPFGAVLTFCPPFGKEVEDAVQVIGQLGAPLCPVKIGNRIAYSRAQQTGQAAQEIEPDGKAAQEIAQLYAYTCMHLYTEMERSERHGKRVAGGSR